MDYSALRKELAQFYGADFHQRVSDNTATCWKTLDSMISEDMSAYEMKAIQYAIIPQYCKPHIFRNTPFYYETQCIRIIDKVDSVGAYTYKRNLKRFRQANEQLLHEKQYCTSFPLFSFCGEYGDERWHFTMNIAPVLKHGLKALYEKAERVLQTPCTEEESQYLNGTLKGLLGIKKTAECFAMEARRHMPSADPAEQTRLTRIYEAAMRTPWNAPQTFYEALNAVAFLHKAVPMLDGASISGMGRLDVMLYPFYLHDLENSIATREEIKDLICQFLLIWDAHNAPDEKQTLFQTNDRGFAYTLGGCDRNGKPIYNDLTLLFLEADGEMQVIYPKIKCRFDRNAPKAYLDAINKELAKGRSTILYQNDDAFLPALQRLGIAEGDAREYYLLGCWEPVIKGCSNEHCGYVNLLKILELSVYNDFNRPDIALKLEPFAGAKSFEEVYAIYCRNVQATLTTRAKIAVDGRRYWSDVDPHMVYSSALEDCIENRRDMTAGGARYNVDELICAGLPNVVDCLLAIKELCFEKNQISLDTFLSVVRNNWEGQEILRKMALQCAFMGDESVQSKELAARLNNDLYAISQSLPTLWGGKVSVGYMLFMEMPIWAQKIRATPDGRYNGDYFARGLTPSYLHKISAVTTVLDSLSNMDTSKIAANSVVNITVPFGKLSLELWEAFLRAVAQSSVQSLQINCVTKEELLEAQKHPEQHQDIVVRVCGYSARFVSLSEESQKEFLQRNFYEK